MKGQRVYIDANFLIYFFDQRAPYFDVVAPLFVACDRGEFADFTGDAAVAEVMVHPFRCRSAAEIVRGKAFLREKISSRCLRMMRVRSTRRLSCEPRQA